MGDGIANQEVLEVIRTKYVDATQAERQVIDYVMRHPAETVNLKVSDLARKSETSDATVVRLCHRMGYSGYKQFQVSLAMDMGSRKVHSDSTAPEGVIKDTFEEFSESLTAVGKSIDRKTLEASVSLIKNANCVHLLATGNTANISQYMGFRLGKIGIWSSYYRDPLYGTSQLSFANPGDIVIAISKSGESTMTLEGAQLAKDKGLPVIAITAASQSTLARLADYVFYSNGLHDAEHFHKIYSYLNEVAIVDALLSFVVNDDLLRDNAQ